MKSRFAPIESVLLLVATALLGGCAQQGKPGGTAPGTVYAISLNDVAQPVGRDDGVALAAARNEWTSFALELASLPPSATGYELRLQAPQLQSANRALAPTNFETYQILPMPVDVNRAAYVRHTGLDTTVRDLPRALLPVKADNGAIALRALRRSPRPAAGGGAAPAVVQLWVDLHVPADAAPGDYSATCDLLANGNPRPIASVPLKLTVYDFSLPDERHLQIVSRLRWEDLQRLYPGFETIRPRLLNRNDPKYSPAIGTLDKLVALAQRHRTILTIPALQPTVKWPANEPPQIDWRDFDTVVAHWLNGGAFPDHQPLGFWPLPAPDILDRFNRSSQLAYWSQAANHFDQSEWIDRTAVWLEKITPGLASDADSRELSALAADMLALHPRLRVQVPLQDDQLALGGPVEPGHLGPGTLPRLLAAGQGLVSAPPRKPWPQGVNRPLHWLRTDLPGLVPYVGAGGDARDVRLWAWLAFLRDARQIVWNAALPTLSDPAKPADPNELIWFYPGQWFGLEEPVPTIQLKWLRRAQQDYEYLWLARERGEVLNALVMARLITKPVEIQPDQAPDPAYALMCGTTDPQAWADAQRLLAESILLRPPGQKADEARQHALYIETLRWSEPQERPLLMGRSVQWSLDTQAGHWLNVRLGIDTYNASDNTPGQSLLQWTALPPGWEVSPEPVQIPVLQTYHVRRDTLNARFDLSKIIPASRDASEVTFTNGFNNRTSALKLVLPVATTDRREGSRLAIDGGLSDWDDADAIQNGPLVRMLSRPNLQQQVLQRAQAPSKIYTGWANERFYVAFDLLGLSSPGAGPAQNFVDYQSQRAWGEDLCELLIQPVNAKNELGPVLHVVCKPNGSVWVERKLDPRRNANPWQPIAGADIRYATRPEGTSWRGELAIPWKVILNEAGTAMPPLVRFNFVQHRTATGESASWAGPVDFGRDDNFMGVLFLRDSTAGGLGDVTQGGL